jgi:uroporphyrinogen decarboxylase
MADLTMLQVLKGATADYTPIWLMRQAGRYLPEYRELRQQGGSFIDFCLDKERAVEATLQPLRRFPLDAAILFSDILILPYALGVKVEFVENHGPKLEPVQEGDPIFNRSIVDIMAGPGKMVTNIIREIKQNLEVAFPKTPLIGFVGAPWTVAAYMIEGKLTRDLVIARTLIYKHPKFFEKLIWHLADLTTLYLIEQIKAGAQIIKIFDSWAGSLNEYDFMRFVIEPTARIVVGIRAQYPEIPIIGFPRMVGEKSILYAKQTGVNCVAIDQSVTLDWAARVLSKATVIQGNLDNTLLLTEPEVITQTAREIINKLGRGNFIFNLSHGVLPPTPPENVAALVKEVRG